MARTQANHWNSSQANGHNAVNNSMSKTQGGNWNGANRSSSTGKVNLTPE